MYCCIGHNEENDIVAIAPNTGASGRSGTGTDTEEPDPFERYSDVEKAFKKGKNKNGRYNKDISIEEAKRLQRGFKKALDESTLNNIDEVDDSDRNYGKENINNNRNNSPHNNGLNGAKEGFMYEKKELAMIRDVLEENYNNFNNSQPVYEQIEQLCDDYDRVNDKYNRYKQYCNKLKNNLSNTKEKYSGEMEEYKEHNNELLMECQALKDENDDLQDRLVEYENEITQLRAALNNNNTNNIHNGEPSFIMSKNQNSLLYDDSGIPNGFEDDSQSLMNKKVSYTQSHLSTHVYII